MLVAMSPRASTPTVAVFDAIQDQLHLTTATLRVLGCRVQPLLPGANGLQDVADQLQRDGPFDVVLWDLPHALHGPCEDLRGLWHSGTFASSGVVVTTADRDRLQPMLETWSGRPAILGRPYTFTSLMKAIGMATALREEADLESGRQEELERVACRVHPTLVR